ncbi:hypothetical protein ACRW38_16935, partial [Escherichia coli]
QKQKKLIMLPSETMIWQPEFTDKTLSRKPGALQFGGSLTLRDYDGQVAEAMALVRALNKMTKAGIPESVRIA